MGRSINYSVERNTINIQIARDREKELKADLNQGLISDAEYDDSRRELELNLAVDLANDETTPKKTPPTPFTAVLITALLPLLGFGLYLFLGSPDLIKLSSRSESTSITLPEANDNVEEMLSRLKNKLRERPDDQRGWSLLANAMMNLGRFEEAIPAYRQLIQIDPGNAEALVRLADAIAMTRNSSLIGEPTALINQAIELNPSQPQGLWLAGIAAQERGESSLAIEYFQRLIPLVEDDQMMREQILSLIKDIRNDINNNPNESFKILVSVAPDLSNQIMSSDTLFVYLKVPDKPGMPIAAKKISALPLPREIILNKSSLLNQNINLSDFPIFHIGAHISKTGSISKQSGDMMGVTISENSGGNTIYSITIDRTID